MLRPGGTANARAVLNAQLDAWRKANDDDDYGTGDWGRIRTYGGEWYGFPTDFQRVLPCKWGIRHSGLSASKRLVHTSSAGYVHDTGPIVTAKLGKGLMSLRAQVNSSLRARHLPTDKKIGAYDYRSRCSLVARNDPNVWSTSVRPFSKSSLDSSDKEHPETHEKCSDEKHGPATPFVNVDDGGN